MIALRDVPKGQPLTISYGNLNNDSLLLDYGFFVQSNPHDRVSRELSLDVVQVCSDAVHCARVVALTNLLFMWVRYEQ